LTLKGISTPCAHCVCLVVERVALGRVLDPRIEIPKRTKSTYDQVGGEAVDAEGLRLFE
jgi:hypothetical protein